VSAEDEAGAAEARLPLPLAKKWNPTNRPSGSPSRIHRRRIVLPCILQQKSPRCIGHLEDSTIGRVSNLFIGQVSSLSVGQMSSLFTDQAINLCRSARAIASARLETHSLDRMLLT
jgi:hypothetical protein